MNKKTELKGNWILRGTDANHLPIEIPISVPGYVHTALEREKIIPEMYWRDNAKMCQWIEERTWEFVCTFQVTEKSFFENAVLEFLGVDTFAEYSLNGRILGQSNNMFVPVTFSVGSILNEGNNELCIKIKPWREMTKDRPAASAAFTAERIHIRRIQCTFFWDWVERFVSAGIWQPVYLYTPSNAKITSLYCYTKSLVKNYASLAIHLTTECPKDDPCRFEITVTDPDGNTAWKRTGRIYMHTIELQADIADPALWWPNGYGNQPLYTVNVNLIHNDGTIADTYQSQIGIRTVQFLYPTDKEGSIEEERSLYWQNLENIEKHTGEGMILIVNGERIFAKGGNWVPPTPFPGDNDEKLYRHLIKLASEGNCNFLRVWGGGIYETDLFYSLCDRYGIMVSQDFIMSCGEYPYTDKDFQSQIMSEAEYNVKRLRNHPSLIFWSGNNENCDYYDWDDPKMPTIPLVESVLQPILNMLDPIRPFRLGSPWGGINNCDFTVGDNHGSWWWRGAENMDSSYFNHIARFVTESPFSGYPLPSTLKKFLSEEDISDPESPITEYHIKNNSYFTDVLHWPSVHGRLIRNSEIMIGRANTTEERIYRRAYVQYEWARFTIEGARRAKWYCSAIQFWMYNDCWPALGYSAIDFYGKPKAGWYGFKRAFASVVSSIQSEKEELTFVCMNDSLVTRNLEFKISAANTRSGVLTELKQGSFVSLANCNGQIAKISRNKKELITLEEQNALIIFCDLYENGILIDRARWYPNWLSELDFGEAELSYQVDEHSSTVTVKCESGVAIGVAFDDDCIFSDNFFDLLPGESRIVTYQPLGEDIEITPYALNGKWIH